MKRKYLIVIIIIGLICLGGQVFARYILTRKFDVKITTAPLYFEAEAENAEIELIDNKAEINLTIKNNDGTNFNFYDTSYEISLLNNEKFEYTINNENITSKTIGNNIINEDVIINLMPKQNVSLNVIECVEIKITSLKPYKKEITIPIEIFQKNSYWEYTYIGNYQTFTAPTDGSYQIELWGASGEDYEYVYSETVGKGAYTSGEIYLKEGETLFVYVGNVEDFNGGGPGEAGGGGATDVRLIKGNWDDFDSLKSRIMVAAGGGGGIIKQWSGFQYTYEGDSTGHGGGLNGYDANYNITNASVTGYGYSGHGASQTDGGLPGKSSGYYELNPETKGRFGFGGYANAYVEGIDIYNHSSGGGSGYYGGGHGVHTNNAWPGGGGGSSFISGHNGCDAILESSNENNIVHSGHSVHYSGYQFSNTKMIDGAGYEWTSIKKENVLGMPTYDGKSTMNGNAGNGHAKITFLGKYNEVIPDFTFSNETYTITMGGYNVYRTTSNTSLSKSIDISNMNYIEFDFYVPQGYDVTKIYPIDSQLEISSSGKFDENEITFGTENYFNDEIISGEWNHIIIPLSDGEKALGICDLTNINFIGLYWNNEKYANNTYTIPNCQIKNFKFTKHIMNE